MSKSSHNETVEIEKLAGQLSISETPQQVSSERGVCMCVVGHYIYHFLQVDEVQDLLESFTSLTLQKRQESQK